MLPRERLGPRTIQLRAGNNGERKRFPRYRLPDSNIVVVDVHKAINPDTTKLIPIFDASETVK